MSRSYHEKIIRMLLFILACTCFLTAQQVLGLHNSVGRIIDPDENEQYNLFPGITDFIHARCIQLSSGQFIVQIRHSQNGSIKTIVRSLDDTGYKHLIKQITETEGQHQKESLPIYSPRDRLIMEIPENRFCQITLRDKSRVKGVFDGYQQNHLFLWQDKSLEKIPVHDIVKIKYYPDYQRDPCVLWGSIMVGALAGHLVFNGLSWAINISNYRRIFNATLGASLGTAVGYYAFPLVNEQILLSYSIELAHNRKKLDPFHNLLYSIKDFMRSIWLKKDA